VQFEKVINEPKEDKYYNTKKQGRMETIT